MQVALRLALQACRGPALCLLAACGSTSATPACDPESFDVAFSGTITLLGVSHPSTITKTYSAQSVTPDAFAYLANVLVRGAATGNSASAVWQLFDANLDVGVEFQLAGARSTGAIVPILTAYWPAYPEGRGPIIGATTHDGMLLLFVSNTYRAATASGTFTVRRTAPLQADLSAMLQDAQSNAARMDGQIAVIARGPGCSLTHLERYRSVARVAQWTGGQNRLSRSARSESHPGVL